MQGRITLGRTLLAGLAGAMAGLLSIPAWATGCGIGVIADLPVTMEGDRLSVPAKVNGRDTRFWLDTGAFYNIMSLAKAKEFDLPMKQGMEGMIGGIGGQSEVQVAHIRSFVIAGQTLPQVEFLVGGTDPGNGLIGRNILGIGDAELDIADGYVKLIDPHNCQHSTMTYWAVGKSYFTVPLLATDHGADRVFKLPVMINGHEIDAVLDTGAETTVISRTAAIRAGINLAGPDVVSSFGGGFGRNTVKSWVVPIAKIAIGDENILNAHIDVIDDAYAGSHDLPDMLLGEDWLMAHHVYVARHQALIYFTYSGGKPFHNSHETPHAVGIPAAANLAHKPFTLPPGVILVAAVDNSAGDPTTAGGLGRRGAARLSASNLSGALADFSAAIHLSPDTADYYVMRARVHSELGDAVAARADLDKALTLDSKSGDVLLTRAEQRLETHDRPGALVDTEAAAQITPPASMASVRVADMFVHLHQPARAVPVLDAVIDAHRDDAEFENLLNSRCWARALANTDLDKALADCNLAIKHGRSPDRLDSRALVYYRKGNFAAAISDDDAALKVAPKQAWSLYIRGQAKIALGQTDAGKADQAAALVIQPDIAEEASGYGIGGKPNKAS